MRRATPRNITGQRPPPPKSPTPGNAIPQGLRPAAAHRKHSKAQRWQTASPTPTVAPEKRAKRSDRSRLHCGGSHDPAACAARKLIPGHGRERKSHGWNTGLAAVVSITHRCQGPRIAGRAHPLAASPASTATPTNAFRQSCVRPYERESSIKGPPHTQSGQTTWNVASSGCGVVSIHQETSAWGVSKPLASERRRRRASLAALGEIVAVRRNAVACSFQGASPGHTTPSTIQGGKTTSLSL